MTLKSEVAEPSCALLSPLVVIGRFFRITLHDWSGRTSPNWPILCGIGLLNPVDRASVVNPFAIVTFTDNVFTLQLANV